MFRKIAAFAASLLVFCLAMLAGATTASAYVEPDEPTICTYHTETKRPIEVPCAQPYGATPDGIQMNSGEFCPLGSYVTADLNWCLTEAMVKDGWSAYDDGTVNESEIDFSYEPNDFAPPTNQELSHGCEPTDRNPATGECYEGIYEPFDERYASQGLGDKVMELNERQKYAVDALEQRVSTQQLYIGLLTTLVSVALVVAYLATQSSKPLQPYK